MTPSGRSKEDLFVSAYKDGSIERWARAGATDKQIATNIGLSRDTFYRYLKVYPDTLDVLQRARKPVVIEAFAGLVRLSQGFHETTTVRHQRIITKANGHKEKIEEVTETDTYYPPQHQACTKVIVNYLNKQKKSGDGVPEEYLAEPAIEQVSKEGRLPELENALKELFFTRGKND